MFMEKQIITGYFIEKHLPSLGVSHNSIASDNTFQFVGLLNHLIGKPYTFINSSSLVGIFPADGAFVSKRGAAGNTITPTGAKSDGIVEQRVVGNFIQ